MTDDHCHHIYLDTAASTPVADEVIAEMLPYLKEWYGNPSSIHKFGRETTRAIHLARKRIAEMIAASPHEITFTSGGTEANNLALKGTAVYVKSKTPEKNRIITSSIEHDAVLEPCKDLEGKACELADNRMSQYQEHVAGLRDHIVERVLKEIPLSRLNGLRTDRIPNNAHFTFFGVNGEDLIIKLDENSIAASTGSACSAKKQKQSHVLKAMGFSYEEITGSLRLSFGIHNTKDEVDRAVDV